MVMDLVSVFGVAGSKLLSEPNTENVFHSIQLSLSGVAKAMGGAYEECCLCNSDSMFPL